MFERRGQEQAPVVTRPERPDRAPAPPPPAGGWQGHDPGKVAEGPGDVEQGVLADLAALVTIPRGRAYLKASALKLARTIDARGDDEPASALAKAVDTLRQTMNQLMAREVTDPDAHGELERLLSAPDAGSPSLSPPLRYAQDPAPPDRRSRNRSRRPRPRSE